MRLATTTQQVSSPNSLSLVENTANGHFYQAIDQYMSWDDARAYAESLSYNGQQGYLVTITSEEENNFVYDLARNPHLL